APNRRPLMEPLAVARDTDIDVTAMDGMPLVDRRQAAPGRCFALQAGQSYLKRTNGKTAVHRYRCISELHVTVRAGLFLVATGRPGYITPSRCSQRIKCAQRTGNKHPDDFMPDTVLTANPTAQTATAQVERTVATLRKVREAVGQAIFGQDTVIEQTLVTLLAGGHGLLIGVPGL